MTSIDPGRVIELSFRVHSGCSWGRVDRSQQPKPPAEAGYWSHSQGCDRRRADTFTAAVSIRASTHNPLPRLPGGTLYSFPPDNAAGTRLVGAPQPYYSSESSCR